MKKNNYFAVHKNKKPKRKVDKVNWKPIYDAIAKASELVKSIMDLQKSMHDFSKTSKLLTNPNPPKYKTRSISELALVCDNSKPEIILDKDSEFGKDIFVTNNASKSPLMDSILKNSQDIKWEFLRRRDKY